MCVSVFESVLVCLRVRVSVYECVLCIECVSVYDCVLVCLRVC